MNRLRWIQWNFLVHVPVYECFDSTNELYPTQTQVPSNVPVWVLISRWYNDVMPMSTAVWVMFSLNNPTFVCVVYPNVSPSACDFAWLLRSLKHEHNLNGDTKIIKYWEYFDVKYCFSLHWILTIIHFTLPNTDTLISVCTYFIVFKILLANFE